MKIRRKSIRSSKRVSHLSRRSPARTRKAPRASPKSSRRTAAPRKASSRRTAKRAAGGSRRRTSRVVRAVRDNPGKSLVILGMIAMVAIVTIVVLVLPSPSVDVDVSGLLGEENVAGQAIQTAPPFGISSPSADTKGLDTGSGGSAYRSSIK